MEEKVLKGGATGIGTILAYLGNSFTPLIYVLIVFEITDYITGIASAKLNDGGVSSKVAIRGAAKKIGYFILIGVAFLFDYVISETSHTMGITFEWRAFLGIMSVCYLISTEAISILENLAELDIKIPFLATVIKYFQSKILKKGEDEIEKITGND